MLCTRHLWIGCLLLASCSAPRWDGELHQWGSLREVMRFGKSEGRVELLLAVQGRPHAVGLGALEGLAGEVLVVDGEVWVSRAMKSGRPETSTAAIGEQAALLAFAEVPSWIEVTIPRAMSILEFESFLRATAAQNHIDWTGAFPFVVRGPLSAVKIHVIQGICPVAHPDHGPEHEPFRGLFGRSHGTLVGFYGEGLEGSLTHHGARTHMHALLTSSEERPLVGHVDEVTVLAGAVLQLPVR